MKNIFIILSIIVLFFGCGSHSQENNQKTESNTTNNAIQFDVVKESVTNSYCYINKVSKNDTIYFVAVDFITFLTGKESAVEASKANVPDPGYYIINDDTLLKTYEISKNIEITLLDLMTGEPISGKSIDDLYRRDLSSLIAKITVIDGKTTKLEQVFVP